MVSIDNLHQCLVDAFEDDSEVLETIRHGYPQVTRENIIPYKLEDSGSVGRRIYTSKVVEKGILHESIIRWLESCVQSISMFYLIKYSDTTDRGRLHVFTPELERLIEIYWETNGDVTFSGSIQAMRV